MDRFNEKIIVVVVSLLLLLPSSYHSASLTSSDTEGNYTATEKIGSHQMFRRSNDAGSYSDQNHSGANNNGYSDDKVINTVLNINDSNSVALLNNFNVSVDEILRRISTLSNTSTPVNDQPSNIENEAITSSSNENIEQRE